MKRLVFTFAVAMVISLLVVSCGEKARVIPPSKFASIYADMFVSDQWLHNHSTVRKQADTTWFYDPIFEKYGYNKQDYFRSVDYYLEDPASLAKILKQAENLLREQASFYQDKIEEESKMRAKRSVASSIPLPYHDITPFYTEALSVERADNGVYKTTRNNPAFPFKGPAIVENKTVPSKVGPDPLASSDLHPIEIAASDSTANEAATPAVAAEPENSPTKPAIVRKKSSEPEISESDAYADRQRRIKTIQQIMDGTAKNQ